MEDPIQWIEGLRATRAYTDDPISDQDLNLILEAGRWTGSSLNSQPWAFVVVTDPDLKNQLSEVGRFSTHLAAAPVVIVLVGEPGRGEFDLGRVAQNMMLAADVRGIGACPATLHDEEAARRLLGVPDDRPSRHAIAFGHPDREAERTVRENLRVFAGEGRKPLEEIVRTEKYEDT